MNQSDVVNRSVPLLPARGGGALGPSFVAHRSHLIWLRQIAPLALVFGTLAIIGYALVEGSSSVLAAYLLFGLAGLAMVWRAGSEAAKIYLVVYGFAAVAAVVLAAIFSVEYGVPYFRGGSDDLQYEEVGLEFAEQYGLFDYGAIRGGLVHEWHNSVGFIYLIGLLAKFSEFFGGFHTMVPRLFNAVCLALTAVLIYAMALRLGLQRKTVVAAALFAGCLPLMMWVSVQTLRDIFQALLIVTLVFLWLPDQRGRWRYSVPVLLVLSVLLLIPIWEMRKAQAFVGLLLVAGYILLNRRSFKPVNLLLMTFPLVLIGLFMAGRFYQDLSADVTLFVDGIESYAEMRGEGGTGGGLSLIVFETPLFPIGWIYRTAYALVSPLPVTLKPLYYAWLSLGTIVHILFLPFLWMGLRRSVANHGWRNVALAFVLLFIGMAMFTFTVRHITQWLPFAILLAALGYEHYRGDPRRVWIATAGVGATLGLLYVVLKIV